MANSIIPKTALSVEKVTGLTARNDYGEATCNYTKVGNVVNATFVVTALSNISQSIGNLQFSGLPTPNTGNIVGATIPNDTSERSTYCGVGLLWGNTLICYGPKVANHTYVVSFTYCTD